jgi:hypothetical protein
MMQSCASAAKLRGGGPILAVGICAMSGAGPRHLGWSSAVRRERERERRIGKLFSLPDAE